MVDWGRKKKQKRTAERKAAFARPGRGQFTPGALSRASARTTKTSVAPVASKDPFVTRGGKSGQLRQPQATPGFDIGMSEAFAAKFVESQNMQSMVQQIPEMEGRTPPSFDDTLTSEKTPVEEKKDFGTGVFGALNEASYAAINTFFDFVQGQGGGDFQKGIYSLIAMPVGGTGTVARESAAITEASVVGAISKDALKSGGVKGFNTFKRIIGGFFNPIKITEYVDRVGKTQVVKAPSIAKGIVGAAIIATLGYSIWKDASGGHAIGTRDVFEELKGMVVMFYRDFARDKDYAAMDLMKNMSNDINNITLSKLPGGIPVREASEIYNQKVNEVLEIADAHYKQMAEMEDEGMTPEQTADFWLQYNMRVENNKTIEANYRTDYFNQQKRIMIQHELDARATERASEAAFWLDYRQKIAAMEEEERQKQADFWLEYRKMVLKLQEDTGRSRLTFGLL